MSPTTALRAALASTALIATAAVSAVAVASPASAYAVAKGDRGPGTITQTAGTPFMTAVVDGAGNAQFHGPDLYLGPSAGDGNGYTVAAGKVETIDVRSQLQEQTAQGWQTVTSSEQHLSVTAGGEPVHLSPTELAAPAGQYGDHGFRIYVAMTWYDGRYVLGDRDVVPSTSYYDVKCATNGVKACSVISGGLDISL